MAEDFAGLTVEIAGMVVMVGMSDDDIDSGPRIEDQLHSRHLFAAIPVGGSVCRWSMSYSCGRRIISVQCRT